MDEGECFLAVLIISIDGSIPVILKPKLFNLLQNPPVPQPKSKTLMSFGLGYSCEISFNITGQAISMLSAAAGSIWPSLR